MPRKANAQRAKARELYEQEGLSLAEIAQQLDAKLNTVKSWKRRDGWNAPLHLGASETKTEKKKKRGKDKKKRTMNPNSLANLQPPFEKGEQRALKHGMYATKVNPAARDVYESLSEDYIEGVKESLRIKIANYIGGQQYLDFSDPTHWSADTRAAQSIGSLAVQLDTLLDKRAEDVEDDGLIDAIKNAGDVWEDEED